LLIFVLALGRSPGGKASPLFEGEFSDGDGLQHPSGFGIRDSGFGIRDSGELTPRRRSFEKENVVKLVELSCERFLKNCSAIQLTSSILNRIQNFSRRHFVSLRILDSILFY
jgi:hypothetical protein